MTEQKLPEEMLHRILSMHFARAPQAYCECRPHWYYNHEIPVHPTSNALLVSKRWLRIGTPLLYEFLNITTKEHTVAIAEMFRNYPDLAKAVRHVRLRGGYGKELKDVLGKTQNVRSLSVSVHVKGKESVAGLVRSIPLLNPSVLYLRVPYGRGLDLRLNKKQQEIMSSLQTAIGESWSSLTLLHLASLSDIPDALCAAIRRSPSLQEVSIDSFAISQWCRSGAITTISENENIARVSYRGDSFEPVEKLVENNAIPTRAAKLLTKAAALPPDDWLNQPMRAHRTHNPAIVVERTVGFSDPTAEQE